MSEVATWAATSGFGLLSNLFSSARRDLRTRRRLRLKCTKEPQPAANLLTIPRPFDQLPERHHLKAVVVIISAALVATAAPGPATARTKYIPFVVREVSGKRPFVQAKLNGAPLLLMVHSNADFFVMTTHANAALAGLKNLKSRSRYGIVAHGKVSALGRAETMLSSLRVGPIENKDVALSVFEVPQSPIMQGMLGVQWLRTNRVVVDYGSKRLGFPSTDADAKTLFAALRRRDYAELRMTWHPEHRNYTVEGTVAGAEVSTLVSTVAENVIGLPIAQRLQLPLQKQEETAGGPAGSVQPVYTSPTPVQVCLGGGIWPISGSVIYDQAVYAGRPGSPAAIEPSITLGADFMLQHAAVIDYGSGTLFVRREAAAGRPC